LYRDSRVDASTNSTGAGEDRDWEHEDYGDDYLRKDYTVTSNAILVHSAHPLSLAGAVMYLLEHPEERERLGGAGRATVESYFKTVDQTWKYANLYRFLASRRKSRAQ
jgi:glycosyltransferase involved in cell wall biosynthesis